MPLNYHGPQLLTLVPEFATVGLQGSSSPYLPTLSSLKVVSTSSSSETGKSKRKQIQKLLLAGRSPKRVAEAVHTSPAIVWKEKSILIAQGFLGSKQNGRFLNRRSAIGRQVGPHDEREVSHIVVQPNKKADNFNDPVIPMDVLRTTKDELSQLYDLFKQGINPTELIINYKFDPEIVEKEYDRFLKLSRLNCKYDYDSSNEIDRKPNQILLDLLPHSGVGKDAYDSYQRKGYLHIYEVLSLFQSKIKDVSTNQLESYLEWKLTKCKKCSNLGQKVLIDPDGKFGMHDSATVDVEDCCYCRDRNPSHPR